MVFRVIRNWKTLSIAFGRSPGDDLERVVFSYAIKIVIQGIVVRAADSNLQPPD